MPAKNAVLNGKACVGELALTKNIDAGVIEQCYRAVS
jgi:hypothetical protein